MWRKRTSRPSATAPETGRQIVAGHVNRPAWASPRGEDRERVLMVEASEQTVAGRGSALTEQLNAGLRAATAGRHAEAAELYASAVALFDGTPAEPANGFHHNFPLQGKAAIALIRWAESARTLGDFETALTCLKRCHAEFRAANEEQGGEEDWWARQWAAEAALRRGDLLAALGRHEEARAQWSVLLPNRGFIWPSLMDWADEAYDRLASPTPQTPADTQR
ncbi:MAG: hypothetical protein QOI15_2423 [Pseudonocardiales bacterium]|nr:hypothetical protein [Pseudonocardiales bacterium]